MSEEVWEDRVDSLATAFKTYIDAVPAEVQITYRNRFAHNISMILHDKAGEAAQEVALSDTRIMLTEMGATDQEILSLHF